MARCRTFSMPLAMVSGPKCELSSTSATAVVAHLQLGLLLQNFGAPLSEDEERAGVFLTNSLTGWEPPAGPKEDLLFEEMEEERDAAEEVKQRKPILVILGNPPYNAFAGTSSDEEGGLVEPYKEGLRDEWGIGKFNLDDLYVRFFRVAERKIAEETGKGIVCYISNHSWVSDPSFVVMRQKLMGSFDKFWIENMHGNRRISERAPDGSTSETIFAVSGFSPGIQQGVAISLWCKRGDSEDETPTILFRDDLNAARATERRQQLLKSLEEPRTEEHYEAAEPSVPNRLSFRPSDVGMDFLSWPLLSELCEVDPPNGLMEKRGGALIDIEKDALEERMRRYFDRSLGWDDLETQDERVTKDRAGYNAMRTRDKVLNVETYDPDRVRRYVFRPFDSRWCYYSEVNPLWNRNRPDLWAQQWNGNAFLISRKFADKDPEGPPFYFARTLVDDHLLAPDANCFPLLWRQDFMGDAQSDDAPTSANLSDDARRYLSSLGFRDPDADTETASMIWMHALAVGFSPAYLQENQDGVRQDWPRVPLPDSSERLEASAGRPGPREYTREERAAIEEGALVHDQATSWEMERCS
jgi:predicted helicase